MTGRSVPTRPPLPFAGSPSLPPLSSSPMGIMRVLGSVVVAEPRLGATLHLAAGKSSHADAVALCLPSRRPIAWERDGALVQCVPGGGMLLDLEGGGNVIGEMDDEGLLLLLPRRLIASILPGRVAGTVVPRSAAVKALHRLASSLLSARTRLTEGQARLAGRALNELVAASLAPRSGGSVALRRGGALLDRLTAFVDGHLRKPLDPATLCLALHCSRAALYRAAAPAGGIAALVNQRRLGAIHDRLCDPAETAAVGTLAQAHGFADPASFSRAFKKRYGVTAGQLRRTVAGRGARDPEEQERPL